ncbi:MAG TPA: hypothetical protein VN976_00285 [Verrucomicrobiae bacterium]|nr:hypothetical protein [Verrucomicrobiae bacterium]
MPKTTVNEDREAIPHKTEVRTTGKGYMTFPASEAVSDQIRRDAHLR